jgi:hypothetical protein
MIATTPRSPCTSGAAAQVTTTPPYTVHDQPIMGESACAAIN